MNTRNKLAATLSAAAVGVGGVAAHASVFADDAVRGTVRVADDFPVSPVVPAATDDLTRTAEESAASQQIVCAAIGFFDVVGDADSTFYDFAEYAMDEIDQSPRAKAERIFEAAQEVYEGDPSALSDIACEF
jgi:hypothetical protein